MDIFNTHSLKNQIFKHNILNENEGLSKISNQLIYQTLILRRNYKYWNSIQNSILYKGYYGLQILPFKIYDFFKIYQETGEIGEFNLLKIIKHDISSNKKIIKQELTEKYEILGQLLNDGNIVTTKEIEIKNYEPNNYIKYWIPVALLIFFGPLVSFKLNKYKFDIINWINENFVAITKGFFENWIVSPLKQCINIIKQDDNIIMSKEALNSDLSSLERMITDYLKDSKIEVPANLHEQIVSGDLTSMMSRYENELRSPIKNLIGGNMIRSLLIQIQKTKVDGDVVISGIDKLIKSQQLLLGIVSVSPSLVICYLLYGYLSKPNFTVNGKDLKSSCLNNLINLQVPTDNISRGNLLINIINLKIESKLILKNEVFHMFKNDLDRLLNGEDVLTKLYSVYASYFK
ncbi:hypothetical protein CLIB1444_09S01508 [[Candida] jaroonii]|uniref:Uncharacterized protein n=1 Tax=[Candida] jaroonii TaxID=467808 RepID=A0ACA9YC72_9ASCO|nr:hypothetical protein CLIB1444_09S01508 [[Candida] jaroonii]